jgi:hypothetical protein
VVFQTEEAEVANLAGARKLMSSMKTSLATASISEGSWAKASKAKLTLAAGPRLAGRIPTGMAVAPCV